MTNPKKSRRRIVALAGLLAGIGFSACNASDFTSDPAPNGVRVHVTAKYVVPGQWQSDRAESAGDASMYDPSYRAVQFYAPDTGNAPFRGTTECIAVSASRYAAIHVGEWISLTSTEGNNLASC